MTTGPCPSSTARCSAEFGRRAARPRPGAGPRRPRCPAGTSGGWSTTSSRRSGGRRRCWPGRPSSRSATGSAGDLLGDDPVAASARRPPPQAVAAVPSPVRWTRTVHLSFGDHPGAEYAMQLAADHLVHAVDLARALGLDETVDAEAAAADRGVVRADGGEPTGAMGADRPAGRGARRRRAGSHGCWA